MSKTVTYSYGKDGKTDWINLLISVDIDGDGVGENDTITYDEIGNPTTYLGAALIWNGRQLTSYKTAEKEISYTYDANGLRASKTVNGAKTKYYYVNGKLHYEERGDGTKLYFFYDSNGYLSGIEYNGTNYYPATNRRGDVVAIYNYLGECIVRYEYDAWGKILSVKDGNGVEITDRSHIANINPIRYRGYYYDTETKLYYLQSRYYNSEVGRFLNADSQLNQQSGPLGFNMFAYGENNPIMFSDPTGHSIILACLIGGAIIGAITGGAIGASVSKIETGKVSAKSVVVGALAGGAIGGAVGAALGYVGQAVATAISASTPSVNSTTSVTKTVAKGAQNPKVKAAIEKGKLMHKQMEYGPGVLKEQTIAPGCRVDGIDFSNRIIYELKPNNPQAIARGMKQLERYTTAATQQYGGTWTGVLKLYG